jgi:hypothetical protein
MTGRAKYGLTYEDNFGFYDFDADPNEEDFFIFVQASSRPATCRRCLEPVRLMPGREQCSRCCEALEFGGQG